MAFMAPVIIIGLLGLALLVTMSAAGLLLLVISARAQGAWNTLPQAPAQAPDIVPAFIRDGE